MSDEMKIKRCPFCGKRADKELSGGGSAYYVTCYRDNGCRTMGPEAPTEAEAIAKWNAAPRRKRKQAGEDGAGVIQLTSISWAEPEAVTTTNVRADGHAYIGPALNAPTFETWEAAALLTRVEVLEAALSVDRDAFGKIDPEGEVAASGNYHAWLGRVLMTQFDRLAALEARIGDTLKRDDFSFSTLELRADDMERWMLLARAEGDLRDKRLELLEGILFGKAVRRREKAEMFPTPEEVPLASTTDNGGAEPD